MEKAGYRAVKAFNPYWDKNGRTFVDPDGYRVVLQQASHEVEAPVRALGASTEP